MPELAELRLTADYINEHSVGKTFKRQIDKTLEHKQPSIQGPSDTFTISAESRGKELKLTLKGISQSTTLMMGMGMVGVFKFTKTGEASCRETKSSGRSRAKRMDSGQPWKRTTKKEKAKTGSYDQR